MKKSLILATLALFLMLTTVAVAADTEAITAPGCPTPAFNILNSVWAGNLTMVQTDGTTLIVAATLTVLSQTDSSFSGELVLSTSPDPTTIALSGIIGPSCERALYMTAENIIMNAAIKRMRGQQVFRINLRGQNVGDGSSFSGFLLLQP